MTDLVLSRARLKAGHPTSATYVFEEVTPLDRLPYNFDYVSAVSAPPEEPSGQRPSRWPMMIKTFAVSKIGKTGICFSWGTALLIGAGVSVEPRAFWQAQFGPWDTASTEELVAVDHPVWVEGRKPLGRWLDLASNAFPRMRAMTPREVEAYRAFKKRISRRIGTVDVS